MRAGFDVQIYEQSPQLSEAGAGLVVSPNASRLLIKLGLGAELQGHRACGRTVSTSGAGRTAARSRFRGSPTRPKQRYGAPLWVFHRGEMHQLLAQALPPERLHLDHRCTQAVERGDHVDAQFENGAAIKADVLIGADGVHSTIRHLLLGPERPRFTGCIAYRGLIPMARVEHLNIEFATNNWMGPGRHFVHYPVSAGRMLNFVGLLEQDSWIKESWTEPGSLDDLAAAYAGFAAPVRGIIDAADHTFKWALLDRDPLPRWSFGRDRIARRRLPPDAAISRPGRRASDRGRRRRSPLVSQRDADDVPAALKLYETLRMPRATKCQTISRNNMTRFHLPDGPAQQERDAKMATGTTDWSFEAIGWLYGHDASVLPAGRIGAALTAWNAADYKHPAGGESPRRR